MPVMSAGVHPARMRGCPGQAGGLFDREGVNVRSKSDGGFRRRSGNPSDDAGSAGQTSDMGDPCVGQLRLNGLAGPMFLVPDLGMGMKVVANIHQPSEL
jgi:hypothetical protein